MPNFASGTIWTGDCIEVMRGLNSECVDLIYLDPPFNSNADYGAPIGSQAAGAAFKDTWTLSDVDAEWINLIEDRYPAVHRVLLAATSDSDKSYLAYMAARLLEMPRLLKPTGSLYLHCDDTMSHYLKLLMDAIWGRKNFRNEIVWQRSMGFKRKTAQMFPRKSDRLLFYNMGESSTFKHQYRPHKAEYLRRFKKDKSGRLYRDDVNPTKGGRRRIYLDDTKGDIVDSTWVDIPPVNPVAKERVGYPTQKPLALLERILKASTNEGDMVLDPFCGCATTLVAADRLQRQWVGIDLSSKAAELVVQRVETDQGLWRNITHRTDMPQRTDLGALPAYNSRSNREALYGQQGGDCAGCREHFHARHLEVDHIIAQGRGGTDHLANLQLLCGHCNRVKGNRGMEYLRTKLQLAA